jgi:hypothetical protein
MSCLAAFAIPQLMRCTKYKTCPTVPRTADKLTALTDEQRAEYIENLAPLFADTGETFKERNKLSTKYGKIDTKNMKANVVTRPKPVNSSFYNLLG